MGKLLFIIIYIFCLYLLFGCRSSRMDNISPDAKIECELVSYTKTSLTGVQITAVKYKTLEGWLGGGKDTLYLLYGWRGIGKKKFWPGMKITVQYNKSSYKIINGKKYYPSRIRIIQ